MKPRRLWLAMLFGSVLVVPPPAWSADDATGARREPALLGGDGRCDSDDPTSDVLERWREEDRDEARDERLERREQHRLEKQLDERFGRDGAEDDTGAAPDAPAGNDVPAK